ncbi:MAG: UpxY family transcription antiterminator [Terracidiphilus sp.]
MAEVSQLNSRSALPASTAESAEKHWFAVYTTYRHEQRVATHFANRAIEQYLPMYRTQHRWRDNSRANLDLPLFPCYVFVRIAREQRVPVLEVPGVLWMVGDSGSQPTSLPELEIETLRAGLDPLRVEPHAYLSAGQRVRIRAGMLAGLEGIVVRRKNSLHAVISLELIMQSIAVEVSADDLEAIDQAPALAGASPLHRNGAGELAFCQL